MSPPPPRLLLGFDSIHDVLAAERALEAAGLGCDLIPTPRALSTDCGMCLACRPEARAALEALVDAGRLAPREILLWTPAG